VTFRLPLGYLVNNKSRIGHRKLSRLPRELAAPFATTPPIAKETPMPEPGLPDTVRRLLRELVLAFVDEDQRERTTKMLDQVDDTRLSVLGWDTLGSTKRMRETYVKFLEELKQCRKELQEISKDNNHAEQALVEAQRAIKERDDIAAKYKELQKQLDPEKAQLEIMYAVEAATKAKADEIATLRREVAQRDSDVEALRASKKKLRMALDKITGKDD
jgi:hypothetical protein